MKYKVDIFAVLRFVCLAIFIAMLSSCGGDDHMRTMVVNPDTNQTSSWEEMDDSKCWQGSIVSEIYITVGKIATSMYSKLTDGAMALMMIAFAIWLSFRLIKHVSSFSEDSPAEVWTEVLQKIFICFVCGLLASSTTNILFVLNTIIFPLYNALLELGSAMISHINSGTTITILGKTWELPFQQVQPQHTLLCQAGSITKVTLENGFPVEPQKMMECLTCAVSERLNFGMRLGLMAMVEMPLSGILVGLLLIVAFLLVKIAFIFYLVDALFRFAMMVMILPLLIMAFAFKPTRNWLKIGFFTILNSAGILMMIAIIVVMILLGLHELIKAISPLVTIGLVVDGATQMANSNGEEAGGLDDLGVPFLVLMMMAFLVIGGVKMAKEMADKLVGGGGEANFQKKIASRAAQLAKLAIIAVGGKAITAMGGKGKNLANQIASNSNDDNDDDGESA